MAAMRVLLRAAAIAAACALSACMLKPGQVDAIVGAPDARAIVVHTGAGAVRGAASSRGQAFLAIPFAAPPVGALRFSPPQPPHPWQGVRDAVTPGAMCLQGALPGAGRQSEDCLTLNVYAPAGADPARPRPVMVWLYGGGFVLGNNIQYDPSLLAQREGVIVVAPNYRLGVFGFLAHPALHGAGEGAYALQDQQAALRWVQANVARFGGDPHNVTLFGESAGAWSICYQLTAPGAAGLFHRAILQSGACTSPGSTIALPAAEAGGRKMAAELGCEDDATAAGCLRRVPAQTLLKARPWRRGLLGVESWSPAYGGDVLPLLPRTAFERGAFMAVPVIDGTNHDEGRLFVYTDRLIGKLWNRAGYDTLLRQFFGPSTPRVQAEYAAEADRSISQAYADILTDSTFACPALTLNALLERRTRVYAYEFDDRDAPSSLPQTPFNPRLQAFHSSEIAYVMRTPWALADPARFTVPQRRLSGRIQGYWSGFARTGAPTMPGAPIWPADRGGDPLSLSPVTSSSSTAFAVAHRCQFWNALGY